MPDFSFEARLLKAGTKHVAGVDEVGRGPLAGPVVAAAVILWPHSIPEGLHDSKQLSEAAREALFPQLMAMAAAVSVAMSPPADIDRINIRNASLLAMKRAVLGLSILPDHALIDGNAIPPRLGIEATALVKGDDRSLSIAAASIIAKVLRDRLMRRLDALCPGYGFASNMGYPTPAHKAAIVKLGVTPHHRLSFKPCKNGTPPF